MKNKFFETWVLPNNLFKYLFSHRHLFSRMTKRLLMIYSDFIFYRKFFRKHFLLRNYSLASFLDLELVPLSLSLPLAFHKWIWRDNERGKLSLSFWKCVYFNVVTFCRFRRFLRQNIDIDRLLPFSILFHLQFRWNIVCIIKYTKRECQNRLTHFIFYVRFKNKSHKYSVMTLIYLDYI